MAGTGDMHLWAYSYILKVTNWVVLASSFETKQLRLRDGLDSVVGKRKDGYCLPGLSIPQASNQQFPTIHCVQTMQSTELILLSVEKNKKPPVASSRQGSSHKGTPCLQDSLPAFPHDKAVSSLRPILRKLYQKMANRKTLGILDWGKPQSESYSLLFFMFESLFI